MRDASTMAALREHFTHFARLCAEASPLCEVLSTHVAEHDDLLALADAAPAGQPRPNLLLGAIHYLLLSGVDHRLADFYPSINCNAAPMPSDTAAIRAAFADFCGRYRAEIAEIIRTRRVQTNEVGRCALLLPAFAVAQRWLNERPLALIELGASAGLALLLDRYRYTYLDAAGAALMQVAGEPSAAVALTAHWNGSHVGLPTHIPTIAARVGVDVNPVDVMDEDSARWLAALVWPEEVPRLQTLRAAIAIARQNPPRLIAADALAKLPELFAAAPAEAAVCIYHSHMAYQMPPAWRTALADLIATLGQQRGLAYVSLEWLDDAPGPQLYLETYRRGQAQRTHLANCHRHGRWLEWFAKRHC